MGNDTLESGDSLATFSINENGSLEFIQLWPAGGLYPRSFSINKAGDKVAVALQKSSRVVVLERNVENGWIGNPIAAIPVDGELTCVVWDEQ